MNTFFKLNNYVIIDLFEIELEANEGFLRFHGSKNFNKNIFFQNKEYIFIPCEFSSFETNSDGRQSRPKIQIGNINNYISRILQDRNDLIGKMFNRKKVLAKDLDLSNFENGINPYGISNFNTYVAYDKFIINSKIAENINLVELELVTKVDIQSLSIPARKVTNDTCAWNYRCYGCNYGNNKNYSGPNLPVPINGSFNTYLGVPVADENDKVFVRKVNTANSGDLYDIPYNGSYNLTSLTYKGQWSSTISYVAGDFVYTDSISQINLETDEAVLSALNRPKNYFVCVLNNKNKFPLQNTDVWVQDKCSKTLRGCRLRYNDNTNTIKFGTSTLSKNLPYLPFGAFPATFPYDNNESRT
jgi:lambda family phage minor tail protein L